MFCENCGAKVEDNEQTCRNCGCNITQDNTPLIDLTQQFNYVKKTAKKPTALNAMIFIIIAFALVIRVQFTSQFFYIRLYYLRGLFEFILCLPALPFAIIGFIKSLKIENIAVKLIGILTFIYTVTIFVYTIFGIFI